MKRYITSYVKDKYPLLAELVKGKTVLDIGCVQHSWEQYTNPDWIHNWLRKHAQYCYGIDKLEGSIVKLQGLGYNVGTADAELFTTREKYDVIYAGEIIEHLANFAGFLTCCEYALKYDGKLIITTVNCFGLIFMANHLRGKLQVNGEHTCWFDMTTLCQLLERFGFRTVGKYYFHRYQTGGKREWLSWLFHKYCPERLRDNIMVVAEKA